MLKSEQNKKDLENLLAKSDYKLNNITIMPGFDVSKEAVEAEVLAAIRVFEAEEDKTPSDIKL